MKPHILLLSSPGIGHLIPVLELGKQLSSQHNVKVTIFVVLSHSEAEAELIKQSDTNHTNTLFEIVRLPNVDISSLVAPNAAVVTKICAMMREIRPALRSAISACKLKSNPTTLIVDLFGTEALCVANEFGMSKYVYIPSNAWFLSFMVCLPTIDNELHGEYGDQVEPFKLPGCQAVRPKDVPDPLLVRSDPQCGEAVRIGKEIPTADAILVNIWEDLQPKTLAALRNNKLLGQFVNVPIYTVGPLIRTPECSGSYPELFNWLDKQPNDSVLYVSFGSGGTQSWEQIIELAWGLELAKQRFIWMVRPPPVITGDGSFFTTRRNHGTETSAEKFWFLPKGFMDRTKKMGIVLLEWAPQINILGHSSVGGFMSHCGWNSILESICNGVPMITWPLYAEQRMNATLLKEELGMAVKLKNVAVNEVVQREEIEKMIRKIMVDEDGHTLRAKAKELKYSAQKALEKGGSSYNALSQIVKECERIRM